MRFPDFDAERFSAVENNYDYLNDPYFDSISFVGHASLFIKIDGNTIIPDPFFSNRAVTVRKDTRVNIDFSKIPEKSVVLISHSHYDHLDSWTVRRLIERNAIFIVPLGLGNFFTRRGVTEVYELNWWEDVTINSVKYTFLPAQHWTMRFPQRRNATLWGGFMIEASKTIYFSGDTGYFIGFREFGNRFDIDYAILEVGAYEPRWFMAYQHMNVPDFFRAIDDLQATIAIPKHHSVIRLSAEPLLYSLYEIDLFLQENLQYRERVKMLRVGEYIKLNQSLDITTNEIL
jgi:L-ascorbate metabolism protein UlaG (beta-lactamase superfamily)